MRYLLILLLPLLLGAGAPEPSGYRMDDYNAPVPDTVSGGRMVDAAAMKAAVDAGAIAIDVLPAPRKPAGQASNMPWLPPVRTEIKGSLWWPEIGRGAITPAQDAWFQRRLAEVTGGDKTRVVAFYCKGSCWMSWNAAKRAIGYGYRNVLWFADGAEAWAAGGYPTQHGKPEAVPAQ